MDLQISVFLLFVLFTAGHSLRCYECNGPRDVSCLVQGITTCAEDSRCSSYTAVTQTGVMSRSKGCSMGNGCYSGSQNVGFLRTVVECCDTDQCNFHFAPDPRTMVPNGKKCYYCDKKNCSNIMICSGSEDRCITVTPKNLKEKEASRNSGGQSRVVKGCITKKMCDSMAIRISGTEVISCCSGNLCNGAESVSQSLLFLCGSLLSFILLH